MPLADTHPACLARAAAAAAAALVCVALPATAGAAPGMGSPFAARGHATAPPVRSYTSLIDALKARRILTATIDEHAHVASVVFRGGTHVSVPYPASDASLPLRMADRGVDVTIARPGGGFPWRTFLLIVFLACVAMLFVRAAVSRRVRSAEASPASKGEGIRSDVEVATAPETRFADVAGCDEAVEELAEIVEFLRTPEKFARVKARMPAGLLLHGPSGRQDDACEGARR